MLGVVHHHHGIEIDWTITGVLLTALFTAVIAVLSYLGYRLVSREAVATDKQRRDEVAHAFALASVQCVWGVGDATHDLFQWWLLFDNTHKEPLRYRVDSLSLNIADVSPSDDDELLSTGGVVASGHSERFGPNAFLVQKIVPWFRAMRASFCLMDERGRATNGGNQERSFFPYQRRRSQALAL